MMACSGATEGCLPQNPWGHNFEGLEGPLQAVEVLAHVYVWKRLTLVCSTTAQAVKPCGAEVFCVSRDSTVMLLRDHSSPSCAPACAPALMCAGEDDGFLMVYVTKPDGNSYMHVYDAATMDATPVAEVSCRWAHGVGTGARLGQEQ